MEFQTFPQNKWGNFFTTSSNKNSLFSLWIILQGEDRFNMEATFSDQTFSHHIRKFIHGEAERLPSICHLNNIINIQCTTSSADLIWDHNDQTSLMASLRYLRSEPTPDNSGKHVKDVVTLSFKGNVFKNLI